MKIVDCLIKWLKSKKVCLQLSSYFNHIFLFGDKQAKMLFWEHFQNLISSRNILPILTWIEGHFQFRLISNLKTSFASEWCQFTTKPYMPISNFYLRQMDRFYQGHLNIFQPNFCPNLGVKALFLSTRLRSFGIDSHLCQARPQKTTYSIWNVNL